jgi:hypothetical protein
LPANQIPSFIECRHWMSSMKSIIRGGGDYSFWGCRD